MCLLHEFLPFKFIFRNKTGCSLNNIDKAVSQFMSNII